MKRAAFVLIALFVAAPSQACPWAGTNDVSEQISHDFNAGFGGKTELSCAIVKSPNDFRKCNIGCVDLQSRFPDIHSRSDFLAMAALAAAKAATMASRTSFETITVVDGYLISRNASAVIDVQKALQSWDKGGDGLVKLSRFKKAISKMVKYQPYMSGKPMLPLN